MTPKPPTSGPALRHVMMPRDTNPQGTIFGGVILSLIDQAAWIEALRQSSRRYVTVAMDKIEFKQPVHIGDILGLNASTARIGRTSITVHVDVIALRPATGLETSVTHADVVLVAVDERGRPVPLS